MKTRRIVLVTRNVPGRLKNNTLNTRNFADNPFRNINSMRLKREFQKKKNLFI